MLTKLFCYFWGHKFVIKACTGRTIKTSHPILSEQLCWKYEQTDFCLRCGIKNPHFEQWYKEMIKRMENENAYLEMNCD
jgi:hypothetical protein